MDYAPQDLDDSVRWSATSVPAGPMSSDWIAESMKTAWPCGWSSK